MRLNLRRIALLTGKCARAVAARVALTPQRVDLMLLARRWRLTQKEIAWRLCVTRPVVSRMLTALEELGLVRRLVDPLDRRRRLVVLTAMGHQRMANGFPEPVRRGAQSRGEANWLRWWREPLSRLGIRIDNVARAREPISYEALAAWNDRYGHRLELTNEYTLPPEGGSQPDELT